MIINMINKMNGLLPFDNYKLLAGTILTVIGTFLNPDAAAAHEIMNFIESISGTDVFNAGLVLSGIGAVGKVPKLK